MNKRKILILFIVGVFIISGSVALHFYNKIYTSNTKEDTILYVLTNSNFDEVIVSLTPFLNNTNSFVWVAKKKNYPNVIKAGRYELKKGMNNNDLVNLLRSGNQKAITISFNNQDSLEKLAGRIAQQIEPDSLTIIRAITETDFLNKNGFKTETALGMYIPNSYQVYWNTSAENFRIKMLKEYNRFWSVERKEKAKKQHLTPKQVIVLASIVQKETQTIQERPKVAQLYLNRLHNNWPLQADPTIIFAIKEQQGQDVVIKRVLLKDLEIDSKYNTYLNRGLPPGPIGMPDISAIDAVINPETHNFYYMCADIENFGKHLFARTLFEHNQNAIKYQRWLTKKGVNR